MSYPADHENHGSPGGEVVLIEKDDRRWWPIAVCIASSILSGALAVFIAVQAINKATDRDIQAREQQRQTICALIVSLDDNARAVPPTTPLGKAQARTYAALRVSQGCPPATN